jgi:hypothetical protein
MSEEKGFLDGNGNDLRYGRYIGGDWYPDHPDVIALKKSGERDRMPNIQRRWILDSCLRPSAEGKAALDWVEARAAERRESREQRERERDRKGS